MITPSSPVDPSLIRLYQSYADGRIGRRGFIRRVSAMAAAGLSIPAWMLADPARAGAAQAAAAGTTAPMLDLAEWTYFFVGVERAGTGSGDVRQRQADVRRSVHAGTGSTSVSDGARTRRRRTGTRLDVHTRRTPGLGFDPARGRLQGVCRRSSRSRPIAVSPRRQWTVPGAEPDVGKPVGAIHTA